LPSGIIIKGIGGFYYVKTENGIMNAKPEAFSVKIPRFLYLVTK